MLRNEVAEIIGSYHHDFDHFYECIQNAVDACQKAFADYQSKGQSANYVPEVAVAIDLKANTVTVSDNGVGMSKEVVLKFFFTPYATSKSGDGKATDQRGEKGVGATFLSYGSNFVHVSTLSAETGELTSCTLSNGLAWATKAKGLLPMPQVEPHDPHPQVTSAKHGTTVTIVFSEGMNISNLSEFGETSKQWQAILRLHTALGYIDFQGNDAFHKALRASLTLILQDAKSESSSVETTYLYPHLTTQASVQLSKLARDTKGHLPETQRDMNVMWEFISPDQVSKFVTDRMNNTRYLRHSMRQHSESGLRETGWPTASPLPSFVPFASSW